jgi:hypothetical protein
LNLIAFCSHSSVRLGYVESRQEDTPCRNAPLEKLPLFGGRKPMMEIWNFVHKLLSAVLSPENDIHDSYLGEIQILIPNPNLLFCEQISIRLYSNTEVYGVEFGCV